MYGPRELNVSSHKIPSSGGLRFAPSSMLGMAKDIILSTSMDRQEVLVDARIEDALMPTGMVITFVNFEITKANLPYAVISYGAGGYGNASFPIQINNGRCVPIHGSQVRVAVGVAGVVGATHRIGAFVSLGETANPATASTSIIVTAGSFTDVPVSDSVAIDAVRQMATKIRVFRIQNQPFRAEIRSLASAAYCVTVPAFEEMNWTEIEGMRVLRVYNDGMADDIFNVMQELSS